MTDFGYDLNFLRYLTAKVPLSVFENNIILAFQEKLPLGQLREILRSALKPGGSFTDTKGYHIYVSVPFCAEDCAYCHCTHYVARAKDVLSQYEEYLKQRMAFFAPFFRGREILSVYFGGGTPSLLSEDSLGRILKGLSAGFSFGPRMNINFEAHPGSLTGKKITLLQRYGLTRLTVGIQSLDDGVLRAAGRRQTAASALRCLEMCRRQRVPFVNVDLVAGLPGQSIESFTRGLRKVVTVGPEGVHVNPFSDVFSSRFYRERPFDFRELVKRRQDMMAAARTILEGAGYYREGFEAYQRTSGADNRQQTGYLTNFQNILGLGVGAQTMLYDCVALRDAGFGKSTPTYLGCRIDRPYSMANYVILHLLKGCDVDDFKRCFSVDFQEVFRDEISFLKGIGMVAQEGKILFRRGRWGPEELFEYFSMTKVFFGRELLGQLRQKHSDGYDKGHVYTFLKDGFMAMMDDAFFLLTLYDLGY